MPAFTGMADVRYLVAGGIFLTNVRPEMRILAGEQGGRQIQTGGIAQLFRGFKSWRPTPLTRKKTIYGWALSNRFSCY